MAALRERLPLMLRSAFTENLTYKGVALFVSVVLWFIVERQLPAPTDVPVRLIIEKDTALSIVSRLPEIRATLVPRSQRLELAPDAVIVRLEFDIDAPDSVSVVLRKRDVVIPRGARLDKIVPDSFVIQFDSLMQKRVPVRSALRIAPGKGMSIAGAPRFEPEYATIIGRRHTVAKLLSVSTVAREVVVTDTTPVLVMLATPALGIDVAPQEVRLRVPVVKMFAP